MMEEQRNAPRQEAGPAAACIGGFCSVTVINRESIQTGILQRWSDQVGEPLRPLPA